MVPKWSGLRGLVEQQRRLGDGVGPLLERERLAYSRKPLGRKVKKELWYLLDKCHGGIKRGRPKSVSFFRKPVRS